MPKTKPNKGDTRRRMIETSLDIFHRKGIHAATLDEILDASGTGKGQFSHYFGNKEGLVHAVLLYFYAKLKGGDFPVHFSFESMEDVEGWFQFFIRALEETECKRGCPIGTIGNDLSDDQELLRQDVRLIFEFTRGALARSFSVLRARGELPKKADPDSLADFCLTIMQGGVLIGKVKRDSESFEHAVQHAMAYLNSLGKRS